MSLETKFTDTGRQTERQRDRETWEETETNPHTLTTQETICLFFSERKVPIAAVSTPAKEPEKYIGRHCGLSID